MSTIMLNSSANLSIFLIFSAEPEDITLCEPFDPYQANATMYNRDER